MTQYHSVQLHSSRALVTKQQQPSFDAQMTTTTITTPCIPAPNRMLNNDHNNNNNNNNIEENNNKVYNVSKKLLVGPSIINASLPTKNKISLPSIKELDNTIITQQQQQQQQNNRHWYSPSPPPPPLLQQQQQAPVTQYRAVVSKSPQFTSSSAVVQHDGRTTTMNTTKRPIKRQRTITPPESTTSTTSTNDIAIIPNNNNSKKRQQQQLQQQIQRCHSCQSTETPEWRKGPLGPRTLCNACGLIWSKLCKQQEEGDRSRRKYKHSISSSPVTIEDCIYSNTPSPSTSSTQGSEKNTSKEKLALSFLLS